MFECIESSKQTLNFKVQGTPVHQFLKVHLFWKLVNLDQLRKINRSSLKFPIVELRSLFGNSNKHNYMVFDTSADLEEIQHKYIHSYILDNSTIIRKSCGNKEKKVICRESLEIIIKFLSLILPITIFNIYSYPYLKMLRNNGFKCSTYFILRKSSEFFWSILFWRLIFTIRKPQVIIVTDTCEVAILRAADISNIKTLEIQHGIYYREHPMFYSSTAYDALKKKWVKASQYLTFGEYWSNYLNIIYNENVATVQGKKKITGDPFLGASESILITLQGRETCKIKSIIKKVINYTLNYTHLTVKVKKHPVYACDWIDDIDEKLNKKFVLLDENTTIDQALIGTMHLLTVSSATIYDALSVGINVIVIDLDYSSNNDINFLKSVGVSTIKDITGFPNALVLTDSKLLNAGRMFVDEYDDKILARELNIEFS